jgi:hypothetical protein
MQLTLATTIVAALRGVRRRMRSLSTVVADESFSMYVSLQGRYAQAVVVEVADEVLDRVVREEVAELGVQLRCGVLWASTSVGRLAASIVSRSWRLAGPVAEQDLVGGPSGCRR